MSLRGAKRRGNLTTWRLPLGREPLGREPLGRELGAERLDAEWLNPAFAGLAMTGSIGLFKYPDEIRDGDSFWKRENGYT